MPRYFIVNDHGELREKLFNRFPEGCSWDTVEDKYIILFSSKYNRFNWLSREGVFGGCSEERCKKLGYTQLTLEDFKEDK